MITVYSELKDSINGFLQKYGIWLAVGLVAVIVVVIVLILILGRKKRTQKPEIAEKSKWVEALGGEENITSSEAYGSRLVVVLVDKEKMNRESLKALGVTSVIEMSEKVTLLLEDKAELVKAEIDKK